MTDDPPDYPRITAEWLHALGLFAQCSAIDWSILMTVYGQTWLRGRPEAPIGKALLTKRVVGNWSAIQRRLQRLMSSERAGGVNLLQAARPPGPTNARWYRINEDWRTWAWGTGDLTPHRLTLGKLYPSTSAGRPQGLAVNPSAVAIAMELREHVRRTVAVQDVPNPEDAQDVRWVRWLGAMERILTRYTQPRLETVLRFAFAHRQWSELLRCPTADKRLELHIDKIAADYDRQPIPNSPRNR